MKNPKQGDFHFSFFAFRFFRAAAGIPRKAGQVLRKAGQVLRENAKNATVGSRENARKGM